MKGICFKEPLFKAIIERRKDMTRRIINPQPITIRHIDTNDGYFKAGNHNSYLVHENKILHPKYKVGERIYLKEPYRIAPDANSIIYKYEHPTGRSYYLGCDMDDRPVTWKNKLFMPESAARHFIEITGVRAEKLQDISEEDCLREGIRKLPYTTGDGNTYYSYWNGISNQPRYNSKKDELFDDECCSGVCSKWTEEEAAKIVFSRLIDRINGKGTWDANPFVWVYDFKLVDSSLFN